LPSTPFKGSFFAVGTVFSVGQCPIGANVTRCLFGATPRTHVSRCFFAAKPQKNSEKRSFGGLRPLNPPLGKAVFAYVRTDGAMLHTRCALSFFVAKPQKKREHIPFLLIVGVRCDNATPHTHNIVRQRHIPSSVTTEKTWYVTNIIRYKSHVLSPSLPPPLEGMGAGSGVMV